MISRTKNQSYIGFKNYGGRGITVCDRWLKVENFIDDMYPSYNKGLTIDRIDVNGNYEPSNCRWVTNEIQHRNTRKIIDTNTSGYRGVSWIRQNRRWVVQIMVSNKQKHIGYFNDAIEAAKAYDNYVIENNLEHTKNFS